MIEPSTIASSDPERLAAALALANISTALRPAVNRIGDTFGYDGFLSDLAQSIRRDATVAFLALDPETNGSKRNLSPADTNAAIQALTTFLRGGPATDSNYQKAHGYRFPPSVTSGLFGRRFRSEIDRLYAVRSEIQESRVTLKQAQDTGKLGEIPDRQSDAACDRLNYTFEQVTEIWESAKKKHWPAKVGTNDISRLWPDPVTERAHARLRFSMKAREASDALRDHVVAILDSSESWQSAELILPLALVSQVEETAFMADLVVVHGFSQDYWLRMAADHGIAPDPDTKALVQSNADTFRLDVVKARLDGLGVPLNANEVLAADLVAPLSVAAELDQWCNWDTGVDRQIRPPSGGLSF